MILKKIRCIKKTIIYDGDEPELYDHKHDFSCSNCNGVITYNVRGIISPDKLPKSILSELINNKSIKINDVFKTYNIDKTFPAYVVREKCNKCSSEYIVLLGLKEIQPSRYNVVLKSIYFQDHKDR